jgi:hypothetical protein
MIVENYKTKVDWIIIKPKQYLYSQDDQNSPWLILNTFPNFTNITSNQPI